MPKPLKRQDQQYTIYALIDPRDDTIRYVGMSKDAQFRLFQHLHRTAGGESKQARHWINELQQSNLTPILKILETIERTDDAYSVACEREHYWIEKLLRAGVPLLNVKGVSGPYPRTVGRPTGAIGKATPRPNVPTLEDLRLEAHLSVAALSRKAGVDMKTVKRAIDGEPVQKVKAVAIVDALSKELERPLKLEEIEGIHYAY